MLIENVDKKSAPYHVAKGLGDALISSGVARAVVPDAAPAPVPNTKWRVTDPGIFSGYHAPPEISHSCSTCGTRGRMSGQTPEQSQAFVHCGVFEKVPPEIQKEFRAKRDQWNRAHLAPGQVPLTPENDSKALDEARRRTDSYLASQGIHRRK